MARSLLIFNRMRSRMLRIKICGPLLFCLILLLTSASSAYAWAEDAGGHGFAAGSAQPATRPGQQRSNDPPVAFAGGDQVVVEGQTVTLDGGGSVDDLGIMAYAWVQLDAPGGSPMTAGQAGAVVLSDSSSSTPAFVTPAVGVDGTTLTFELTVTDGDGARDADDVQITVDDNGISDFDGMPGVVSTWTSNNAAIAVSVGGGNSCTRLNMLPPQDMPASSSQLGDLLYGLMDFELKASGSTPGMASITIYFPAPAPEGYKWFKYTASRGWFDFDRDLISAGTGEGAVFSADRTRVTLYVEDNGANDDDLTAGVIRDPGGLAAGSAASPAASLNPPESTAFSGGGGGCFVDALQDPSGLIWPALIFFGALILLSKIHGIFTGKKNPRP
jgi:K319L-like, PKD domain